MLAAGLPRAWEGGGMSYGGSVAWTWYSRLPESLNVLFFVFPAIEGSS